MAPVTIYAVSASKEPEEKNWSTHGESQIDAPFLNFPVRQLA